MNFTNVSNSTVYSKLFIAIPNPDQGLLQSVVFSLFSLLLISVALSSNLFIIVNLLKKSPITASHHLIINLCFTDIVKCLVFFATFNVSIFCGSWQLGTVLCKLLPGLFSGYLLFSIGILSIISKQRYHTIAHPFTHNQKIPKTYIMLAIFWLFDISSGVSSAVFEYEVRVLEGAARCSFATAEGKDAVYNHIGTAVGFFLPVVISHSQFLIYYVKIRRLLQKNLQSLRESDAAATSQRIQRNKRATNTVLVSVLAYDFIMIPGLVFIFVAIMYHEFEDISVLREWGMLWLLVYSCVNPVFFIWRNNELKSAWKRFVKKMGNSNGN